MPKVWREHFLFARDVTGAPVVVGEIGGVNTGLDAAWESKAMSYFGAMGVGIFSFCLNPPSGDTGGVLQNGWATPAASELALLSRLPPTSIVSALGSLSPPSPPDPPPLPVPAPPPDARLAGAAVFMPPPGMGFRRRGSVGPSGPTAEKGYRVRRTKSFGGSRSKTFEEVRSASFLVRSASMGSLLHLDDYAKRETRRLQYAAIEQRKRRLAEEQAAAEAALRAEEEAEAAAKAAAQYATVVLFGGAADDEAHQGVLPFYRNADDVTLLAVYDADVMAAEGAADEDLDEA
mgnify:CR=1 FL=1